MLKLLPPVYDNSEVLLALSSFAGSFSTDQRLALGLWLQNSAIFKNISCLSDSVIQEVGNLLPLLPLNKFQELNPHQVLQVLPYLTVVMPSSYQRIILSKVFQIPNVTAQDMELLGPYICQADVQDLWQFQQNQDIFVVLKSSLLECVKQKEHYPDSKMLDFLFWDVPWRYPQSLSWQSVSTLAPVLPSLGVTFLQSLRLEQVLPALADVGSVSFTPAQAC
ncbi:putative stereocilin-like protein [Xenopus laevis]|nr:putative stereocilin-like protein [Xenopus laevis]